MAYRIRNQGAGGRPTLTLLHGADASPPGPGAGGRSGDASDSPPSGAVSTIYGRRVVKAGLAWAKHFCGECWFSRDDTERPSQEVQDAPTA